MQTIKLTKSKQQSTLQIDLPASKSISNRLLIAQAIAKGKVKIDNVSNAEDSKLLEKALKSKKQTIDVGMAGTAYRFLTAYYAIQEGRTTILTGADRMKVRPIRILVEALRKLGASINYLEKKHYPPLEIHGKALMGGKLKINGSVSSQYVSALLLIAPALQSPLHLEVSGMVSRPYVSLTLALMTQMNLPIMQSGQNFLIKPGSYYSDFPISVDADWSSAAFFYQVMVFSKIEKLSLMNLKANDMQGDQRLVEIFQHFGIETRFNDHAAVLQKVATPMKKIKIDLSDCPDLIPSVSVVAAIYMEEAIIEGVSTLRVKESNRVHALKNELGKINAGFAEIDADTIVINQTKTLPSTITFKTYNDHRMAMCLAPLAYLIKNFKLENPDVVVKSFPDFWNQLEACGLKISKI